MVVRFREDPNSLQSQGPDINRGFETPLSDQGPDINRGFENSAVSAGLDNSAVSAGIDAAQSVFDPSKSAVSQALELSDVNARENRDDFTRTVDRGPQVDADIKLTKKTSPFARLPNHADETAPDFSDKTTAEAANRFFGEERNDPTADAFRQKLFGREGGINTTSRAAQSRVSRPRPSSSNTGSGIARPNSDAARQKFEDQERLFNELNSDDRLR